MRCTLCPVRELTRETEEIDCGKCDSYTRCCRNFATTHTEGVAEILQSLMHWMYQKFCGHLYTGRRRNSVSTLTLDIAEICDHWYTGCGRNSATFYKWMWQKFCNDSYTGCCRNSATTHTLDVAEILRPHSYTGCRRNSAIIHDHTKGVADILRPIIHWVLQKFYNHSDTESGRKSATIHTLGVAEILQPLTDWMSKRFWEKILHWQYHTFELVLELLPNKSQNKEKEIELNNVYKAICRRSLVQFI